MKMDRYLYKGKYLDILLIPLIKMMFQTGYIPSINKMGVNREPIN
jgi:hypothetical protein